MLKKLLTKVAVAAAVASALVVASPVASEAKTSVKIFIGTGYWTGPGIYGGRYRDKMSCWEGAYIVDHSQARLLVAQVGDESHAFIPCASFGRGGLAGHLQHQRIRGGSEAHRLCAAFAG